MQNVLEFREMSVLLKVVSTVKNVALSIDIFDLGAANIESYV